MDHRTRSFTPTSRIPSNSSGMIEPGRSPLTHGSKPRRHSGVFVLDDDPAHPDPAHPDPAHPDSAHPQYGGFVAYCFSLNYILGVGILSIPWGFVRAGLVLSPLVLLLVTLVSWVTAVFILDVMARAQACFGPPTGTAAAHAAGHVQGDGPDYTALRDRSLDTDEAPINPRFTVGQHKFEMNSLVGLFLGKSMQRVYEATVMIYLVGALWSYTSVFASSFSSHVGLPFLNGGSTCSVYTDTTPGCTDLYMFYVACFAVVVIPLTCLDLTEQKPVQIALSMLRFIAVTTMISTTAVAIWSYPSSASTQHASPPFYANVSLFNWGNLGKLLPITVYSQIFHHSIPGLSQPVQEKHLLTRVYGSVLSTTFLLYSSLGLVLAVYFGAEIEQACTLNWAHYTGGISPTPVWATLVSFLVVLFPPFDVVSAFPLNGLTLGNNLMAACVTDPATQRLARVKVPFRLLAAVPPIAGALFFRDLKTVLDYAGCTGIILAFLFPTLLQWASINTAQVQVGDFRTPFSTALATNKAVLSLMIALAVGLFATALTLVALG